MKLWQNVNWQPRKEVTMGKANLREALESFSDNVKSGIPTTLQFDGEIVYLTAEGEAGKVGIVTDLTDDPFYRLIGDDIGPRPKRSDKRGLSGI